MRAWIILLATWFYSGTIPIASGTFGTLAALPFIIIFYLLAGQGGVLVFALLTLVLGIYISSHYIQIIRKEDPSEVVIDEVAGIALTLCVVPLSFWNIIIGFILFRAFDIFKPYPINICDEKIRGGLGIMLDDILAAIYAASILWGLNLIF
jgi:phosphatidylglycerophosphatase A